MCTLTCVRQGGTLRVVCSRDESPLRPRAIPPRESRVGGVSTLMPIDPQGGGTWLGVNAAGLVIAILNKSHPHVPAAGRESRGIIIPSLLEHARAEDALAAARSIDAQRFRGFRLAIIDLDALHIITGDGERIEHIRHDTDPAAWCIASSGLGDAIVEPPRQALFRDLVIASRDRLAAQHAYHEHGWPESPHLSVDMDRGEARTVSITSVEIAFAGASTPRAIVMRHQDRITGESHIASIAADHAMPERALDERDTHHAAEQAR